jgi:nucleoside-diphosphate kinase
MSERTLIIIKPDGVRRGLVGEVVGRIERKELCLAEMKMFRFDEELMARFYQEHLEKPFFPNLKQFILSGPCVAMVVEGKDAIAIMRKLMGATSYLDAEPGTVRGDFALDPTENIVHGSDGPESATREIGLIFSDDQIPSP